MVFENGIEREEIVDNENLKAGDIVKLKGHSIVPADLLLIFTSNYQNSNQCYIETANIDGETNLKVREAPPQIKTLIKSSTAQSELFKGFIEFEPPNKNIHNFVGALYLDAIKDPIALSPDNILLRSSLFSNTDWGYGVVIYTGQETKIQMNNRQATSKLSSTEKFANTAIILIFFMQVINKYFYNYFFLLSMINLFA